jgi:hypothetical protein
MRRPAIPFYSTLALALLLPTTAPARAETEVRNAWLHVLESPEHRALAELAEFWCDGANQRIVYVVTTPEQHRVILEDVSDAPADRFTTRLRDEATGWWIEAGFSSGVRGLDPATWPETIAERSDQARSTMTMWVRTSTGSVAQAVGPAEQDRHLRAKVVHSLVRDPDFAGAIPPAVWEEVAFFTSLDPRIVGGVGHVLFGLLTGYREAIGLPLDGPPAVYRSGSWRRVAVALTTDGEPGPGRRVLQQLLHGYRDLPGCAAPWR